ncbi:MAG: signal peptidase II [Thermoleophilia bacterium]
MSHGRRLSADHVRQATERRTRRQRRSRWTLVASLAAVAFALDLLVKIMVRSAYREGEGTDITGFLRIGRVTNDGIAFGLFPGNQSAVAIITLLALCGIAVALVGLVRRNTWAAAGAGLLVGGSLGNLLDRVTRDGVTDFIHVGRFAPFNVADCCITVGAVMIVMGLMESSEGDASR